MSYMDAKLSIDAIKDLVKKLKNNKMQSLSTHEAALALSTVGFRQVCSEFGTQWTDLQEQNAFKMLANSQYDLSWFGKTNNANYVVLLQHCLRGDIEKIKEVIRNTPKQNRGELVSTTNNQKQTALHIAVKEGFDVLAEYLISEGWNLKARDRELKTPLHYCENELSCHALLKKGASVLARDNKFCTPVHYASATRHFKPLELMLKKSNVVNEPDATGKTPLFYAVFASSEEQINIMRILLENGANINYRDQVGRTPLHYAAELAKIRCVPFLLQKKAQADITDHQHKTALDLATHEKTKKIFTAYYNNQGLVLPQEQKKKRNEFRQIQTSNLVQKQEDKEESKQESKQSQILSGDVNQVATWVREKLFVLMKKLQESGVKALWHIKRPYIYTGSWAEDVDGIEDLYDCFLNVSGPQAAMRTFNILCPYDKKLPTVLGKSEEAFQSFFGESWFSTDPIEKIRNMHSTSKVRSELEAKAKECEDLKTQLIGYRGDLDRLENMLTAERQSLKRYEGIEEELRKERSKGVELYSTSLKHLAQIMDLKNQLRQFSSGEQHSLTLANLVEELKSKNQDLISEIKEIKIQEAAARRRCGQLFLQTLARRQEKVEVEENNLYDDDAILNLYEVLRGNPPGLEKRFLKADRRGNGSLTIDEFTRMLEELMVLPQDIMSLHRITGFAFGRKTLSLPELRVILESRHKARPMWEKRFVRKIKDIITAQNLTVDGFFQLLDVDNSATIDAGELRKGLQQFNIFLNQTDWSNLFSLLDSDNSGTIDLNELKTLIHAETTGKMDSFHPDKLIESDNLEKKSDPPSEQRQNQLQLQQQQHKQDINQQQKQPLKQEQIAPPKETHSENELLSNEQEFNQEYEEKDSEEEGILTLNGEIKVQLPLLQLSEGHPQKVYVRFTIEDMETVKLADFTLPKLKIALKFEMIQFKVTSFEMIKLQVSVFATRDFNEENYLGQATVDLKAVFEEPNTFAVNDNFSLEAGEYQKEVSGKIGLQAKWIPKEQ